MRDEEQGGHRWERVRGKHSRRCAPATGGVPMPKMRCIDRKVRAESRSSEQTNLGCCLRINEWRGRNGSPLSRPEGRLNRPRRELTRRVMRNGFKK